MYARTATNVVAMCLRLIIIYHFPAAKKNSTALSLSKHSLKTYVHACITINQSRRLESEQEEWLSNRLVLQKKVAVGRAMAVTKRRRALTQNCVL